MNDLYQDHIDQSEENSDTDVTPGQEGDSAEENPNVDSDTNEEQDEEQDEEPAKNVDVETSEEGDEPETDETTVTEPDDNNKAWQKRVDRLKRSQERDFLAEVNSLSDGVTIERKEIPQATRLWSLLKANPELTQQIQGIIDTASKSGKLTDLKTYAQNPLNSNVSRNSDATEDRMELHEARLDLKFSDPVFKKYESAIMKWADDNDFPIKSKKNLNLAYKAWKGENSSTLVAHTEANIKKKASATKQATKDAKLVGKTVSPVKPKKINYRTASDQDILKAEGLSLFKDDD